MTSSGPTQTAEKEIRVGRWAARASTARLIRFALFLAPLIGSLILAFWAARTFPPESLGLNRWIWWTGLVVVSTALVQVLDRMFARFTPIATLFQLSLVFPDQAPSRFSVALRSGSARSLQRRLDEIKETGEVFSDKDAYAQQMLDLIRTLSVHDRMTRGHAERVRAYSELIGEEMGLRSTDLDKLRWAALLHDMGKLDVPSEILNKPGRPTEEEWKILQGHPAAGIPYLAPLADWLGDWIHAADGHHERWDGGGYPAGLAGTDIPLSGRLVAVADAFDVMTSTRSYKKAMSLELGRQEIADKAGSQFDPEVARAFLKVSLGDVRRAAGPWAWLTGLPGIQHVPLGAVTSQAVATAASATAVAIAGVTGVLPDSPAPTPPPVVAFVDETPTVTANDIVIEEDSTGTIVVIVDGAAPFSLDVSDVPDELTATVGDPQVAPDGTSASIPISVTPSPNTSGVASLAIAVCANGLCVDEIVNVNVVPQNDRPEVAVGSVTVDRGGATVVGLTQLNGPLSGTTPAPNSITGYDVDDDTLRIISVSGVTAGTVSFTGEAVTYTHDGSLNLEASFIVGISDGEMTVVRVVNVVAINNNSAPVLIIGDTDVVRSSPVGTAVATLLATDVDGDAVVYALIDPSDAFALDPITGVLSTADVLTVGTTYQLEATATDPTGDSASATFAVSVVSDNTPPALVLPTGPLAVREGSPNGTVVATIAATDAEGDAITFSIDGPAGPFAIDPTSGIITVVGPIDHEATPTISLIVAARDALGARTSQTIAITITDVNEAPKVTAPNFAVFVPESSPIGYVLGTVSATDPEGDTLTYAIDPNPSVTIDPSTGRLLLAGALDHETNDAFTVQVTVVDSGVPAKSTLHSIDIIVSDEDEAPTVTTTGLAVDEVATVGSTAGVIVASDPESDPLTFAITGGSGSSFFAINPTSGELTVLAALDHETDGSYTLDIVANDGANITPATIVMTITDINEPPTVGSGQIYPVRETDPLNVPFASVLASDVDGSTFTYSITGGNVGGAFAIDPTAGDLEAVSALDYETVAAYSLTITVTETGPDSLTGSAVVDIIVGDEFEPPIISDQALSVLEDATPGTSVGTVVATDPDVTDTLTYTIISGNPGLFDLASTTGDLTTAAAASFDTETTPMYTLRVEVSDGIFPVQVDVTVTIADVDEPAEFSAPLFTTFYTENDPSPAPINVSASDPEGDAFTFTISSGNTDGTFTIDGATGQITVVGTLDHETNPNFLLKVVATQDDDPSLVTSHDVWVVVSNVDEAPIITSGTTAAVSENEIVPFEVHSIVATDPESETLTYSLGGGPFSVDSSGAVRVSGPIDFEATNSYTVTVTVSDQADPTVMATNQTITITVLDVNEAPTFTLPAAPLAVPEDATVGTVVGTIAASDPDSGDSITFGGVNAPFAIDPSSGVITVTAALNHEVTPDYTFGVTITDAPDPVLAFNDSRNFTITVDDVNEEPTITTSQSWTVNEATPIGTSFGTVVVTDPDTSPTYMFAITSGNGAGLFAIDNGGVLTVANALDFETMPALHTLGITVTDGPHVKTGTVDVILADGPESPVLTVNPTFSIDENTPATTLGVATGVDPESSPLTFSIVGTDHGGLFALADPVIPTDPPTKLLTITRPVDYETEPTSYTIDIEVTDGVTTPDVQTVTITIGPVNEAPAILGGQTFTVVENEAGTTVLHSLATTDVDSGDSIASYAITGGTGASLFSIDASGDIRRTGTLDYNTEQAYTLDVTATDVGGLPATGTVTIDVKSRLGDLSPYYGQVIFNEVVYRDSGSLWTAAEITNVAGVPISTLGWQITDHELGVAPTESLWTSHTVGVPSIQPGDIFGFYFDPFGGPHPLTVHDDLWLWDDSGRLVAYLAWGDETAPGSEIASRPPIDEWNLWTTDFELALGLAADGQSISRTPNGNAAITSDCWEPTTSDEAQGRCAGALPTIDSSSIRTTSIGNANTNQLVISEFAVDHMFSRGDFIEVYNYSNTNASLAGIELQILDTIGFASVSLSTIQPTLGPGEHLLIVETGSDLDTAGDEDATFGSPSIQSEFGIRIYNTFTNVEVDAVGSQASAWAGVGTGAYIEGGGVANAQAQPGFEMSFERLNGGGGGNCIDTNDNSTDFVLNFANQAPFAVNPQNSTDPPELCGAAATLPGPTDHLIISEFRTDGPAGGNDEFVEFFNPTPFPIDASGYEFFDDGGGPKYTFPASTIIPSGEHWLLGTIEFQAVFGPTDGTYNGVGNGNNGWRLEDGGAPWAELDRIDVGTGPNPVPGTSGRFAATIQARDGGCVHDTNQSLNYIWSAVPTPTLAGPAGVQPC